MRRRIVLEAGTLCLGTALRPAGAADAPAAAAPTTLRITVINRWVVSWILGQMLTRIYKIAGIQLQLVMQPTVRAGISATSGEYDGEAARILAYGADHPELIRVEPPLYTLSVRAYALRTRGVAVRKPEDLRNYTLGSIFGMYFARDLIKNHPALTQVGSAEPMFKMLQAGRLDTVIDTAISARRCIQRLRIDAIESPELAHMYSYHYLHQRHAALVPVISGVMQTLQANGQLAEMVAQFERVAMTLSPEQFD